MKITIKADPKEIADLVTQIQSRQFNLTINSESVFNEIKAKNDIWKKQRNGSAF